MKIDISTKKYPNTFAIVDDDIGWALDCFKWHPIKGHNTFYARRCVTVNGKSKFLYMHREILGGNERLMGFEVDHKDHDGLNNVKENLRKCTHQQNQQNNRQTGTYSSKFKGVYWNKQQKVWMVRIQENKRDSYIGRFHDEQLAAKAYDLAAIRIQGDFARLNFPA